MSTSLIKVYISILAWVESMAHVFMHTETGSHNAYTDLHIWPGSMLSDGAAALLWASDLFRPVTMSML